MRMRSIRRPASAIVFAVAVLAVTYGLLVVVRPPAAPPAERTTVAPISPPVPASPPIPASPPRTIVAAPKSVERADLKPDPRTSLEPYTFGPPFQIDDGLTFGPEKAVRTRLSGLAGPGRDAVCRDKDGYLWACGLQARAALNNLIRARQVTCTPTGPSGEVVPATCVTDGVDLGRRLVELGYARSETDHRAEMDRARAANAGMWNGGWQFK